MSRVTKAILNLVPNAVFSYNGTDIRWADERPQPTDEELQTEIDRIESEKPLVELRAVRNEKLAETDWTQSRDVTLTNDAAWQTYRQALRDITDTYSDLDSVVWPTKPE